MKEITGAGNQSVWLCFSPNCKTHLVHLQFFPTSALTLPNSQQTSIGKSPHNKNCRLSWFCLIEIT